MADGKQPDQSVNDNTERAGDMTGDEKMQQNTTVTVDWLKMNVPTLALLAGSIWWLATAQAKTEEKFAAEEAARIARGVEFSKQIEGVKSDIKVVTDKVDPMTTAFYRVGVIEGQLVESNRKSDKLSDAVVELTTAVGKLSTKIDILLPGKHPQ